MATAACYAASMATIWDRLNEAFDCDPTRWSVFDVLEEMIEGPTFGRTPTRKLGEPLFPNGHDPDFLNVTPIPRTGYMPKQKLLPPKTER